MKKLLIGALLFSLAIAGGCKKAEDKSGTDASKPSAQKPSGDFKPEARKKKGERAKSSLKIFSEQTLVSDIPQAQYGTLANSKVKVGNRQMQAVLLKDLLSKYNIKGKNVILAGETVSTPLTWEQASSGELYVVLTPKKFLRVYTTSKPLSSVKFPKRVEKITVSDSSVKPTT